MFNKITKFFKVGQIGLRKKAGFTLIELLIVVAIIAIIATAIIIVINPGSQFQQARNAARWSHMNAIVNGIYSYVLTNGSFPTGCVASSTAVTPNSFNETNCGDLTPVYIPIIPTDPLTDGYYGVQFIDASESRVVVTVDSGAASDNDGTAPQVIQ